MAIRIIEHQIDRDVKNVGLFSKDIGVPYGHYGPLAVMTVVDIGYHIGLSVPAGPEGSLRVGVEHDYWYTGFLADAVDEAELFWNNDITIAFAAWALSGDNSLLVALVHNDTMEIYDGH